MSSTDDLCRLCLNEEDLVCIFDERIQEPHNMKEIIFTTTGVEINETDSISKSACSRCLQITIKMFKFRTTALKNDQELRDKAALVCNVEVKEVKKENESPEKSPGKNVPPKPKPGPKKPTIHPSVSKLFGENSLLKLPAACLNNNIAPVVTVDKVSTDRLVKKMNSRIARTINPSEKNTTINNKENMNKSVNALEKPETQKKISFYLKKADTPINKPYKDQPSSTPNLETTQAKTNTAEFNLKIVNKVIVPDNNQIKFKEKRKADENIADLHFKRAKIVENSPSVSSTTTVSVPSSPDASVEMPNLLCKSPEGPVSVLEKSVSIRLCEICNEVFYNIRDLKSHLKKHMKCQFCKLRFKSLQSKERHLDGLCKIRNMMNNLPNIDLHNILLDGSITSKYKEAFIGYEAFMPLIIKPVALNANANAFEKTEKTIMTSTRNIQIAEPNVLPADELPCQTENLVVASTSKKDSSSQSLHCEEISLLSDDEDELQEQMTILNSETGIMSTIDKNTPPTLTPIKPIKPKVKEANEPKKKEEVGAKHVIKPDIKIRNDFMGPLDPKASDVKILKDLLYKQSVLHLCSEKEVQTATPAYEDVYFNKTENLYEFTNLKSQLVVYKIPVQIKNGLFGVNFDYTKKKTKKRTINVWFDKPIDITPAVITAINNEPNNPKPVSVSTPNIRPQQVYPPRQTYPANFRALAPAGPRASVLAPAGPRASVLGAVGPRPRPPMLPRGYNPTPRWGAHANTLQTNQNVLLFAVPTENGQASATVTAPIPTITMPVALNHTMPSGATIGLGNRLPVTPLSSMPSPNIGSRPGAVSAGLNHTFTGPSVLRSVRPGSTPVVMPAGLNHTTGNILPGARSTSNTPTGTSGSATAPRSMPATLNMTTASTPGLRNILPGPRTPTSRPTNSFNPLQTTSIGQGTPFSNQPQVSTLNQTPGTSSSESSGSNNRVIRVKKFSDLT
ncbi:unnamed protein product [Brassicogethes aeneus]|uniref:ZAD domain-containing protein n=1 Tax=Brassicogethes aeneus TaxID=1431903 RepID=A0A9P0AZU0_BRAAE|nr:unnamed protein product [Brassicogethes aeneus]